MKKNFFLFFLLSCLLLSPLGKVLAMTPTLTLTPTGSGDAVQITVTGDANASALLFYTKAGVGTISGLGVTNTSGSLATTVSTGAYGIDAGSTVYVATSGLNGPRSAVMVWPVNSTVANNSLAFSQTNPTVAVGQSLTVTISGGGTNPTYTVSTNSNSNVVQAGLSGANLNLTGLAVGTATITVCSSVVGCGNLAVTVTAPTVSNPTFSQTNPTMVVGQNLTIIVSGGGTNPVYSLSANSNGNVVQTILSGNSLNLNALIAGSSNVTVCSSVGGCSILTVTVAAPAVSPIVLTQNNLWLVAGQNFNVNFSGGAAPYSLTNPNNFINPSLNGNILTVTAVSPGVTALKVCSAAGDCATLMVLVTNTATGVDSATPITLSVNQLVLTGIGATGQATVTGNGGYFLSNNTKPNVAAITLSGNTVFVGATAVGNTTVSVCQNGSQCANLTVTVSTTTTAISSPTPAAVATTTKATVKSTVKPQYFNFPAGLSLGLGDADKGKDKTIANLQTELTGLGFKVTVTGKYDKATVVAMKAWQISIGIAKAKATGNFGPSSLVWFNNLYSKK